MFATFVAREMLISIKICFQKIPRRESARVRTLRFQELPEKCKVLIRFEPLYPPRSAYSFMIPPRSRVAVITRGANVADAGKPRWKKRYNKQRRAEKTQFGVIFLRPLEKIRFRSVIIEKLLLIDRKEEGEFSASFPPLKTQSENHFSSASCSPTSSQKEVKTSKTTSSFCVRISLPFLGHDFASDKNFLISS